MQVMMMNKRMLPIQALYWQGILGAAEEHQVAYRNSETLIDIVGLEFWNFLLRVTSTFNQMIKTPFLKI